ncbi:hypothetical protein LguiA_011591 [Lonicera macranthoides]
MEANGISPDEVTMATVISASAHLGVLDLGKEIHLYVLQNGFDLDVYIGSALIDMYAKCGSLDRSLLVFFKLQEKNIFCWNSVINGLALHGHANEALAMFSRMEKEKIKPNGITFISILSACTHAGLVHEGRRRFQSMLHDFSIPPEIEHYGCMVNLLCKASLLDDALKLIRSMRMEPNCVIWGALLGGCKLHKNLEIAHLVVDKLIVLEPNNSGYYTLLVNMYAEANRWSDVAKIRATMKEHCVEKICPGSSWIETDRNIHQFAASDQYHVASSEIYLLLDELYGQLRRSGNVTEFYSEKTTGKKIIHWAGGTAYKSKRKIASKLLQTDQIGSIITRRMSGRTSEKDRDGGLREIAPESSVLNGGGNECVEDHE